MATKTNIGLTQHALAWVGRPYWYGTVCYDCTASLLKNKTAQYPTHYTSDRTDKYNKDIAKKEKCTDCIGLPKGYMWLNEATGKSGYGSNDCPDKSANGMFSHAKSLGLGWGVISTLPEIPGLILWRDGHVGVYIGDGYLVEARGFAYGVQKNKVAGRKFTHWFMLPGLTYVGSTTEADASPAACVLGERMLRLGSTGDDVKALQLALAKLNYVCGEADGVFGKKTLSAVKGFQTDHDLEVDGIYGPLTHAELLNASKTPAETEPADSDDASAEAGVVIGSATANIRAGAGNQYAVLFVASKGTGVALPDTTGWTPVLINGMIGWVSNDDLAH